MADPLLTEVVRFVYLIPAALGDRFRKWEWPTSSHSQSLKTALEK